MKLGTISIQNNAQLDRAIIRIEGVIGLPENWQFDNPDERTATYDKFRKVVRDIGDTTAKNIDIHIASTGGDVNDALLIYDTVRSLHANVTTISHGYTASAATIIAQCGNKRQISANSLYLIHRASTSMRGNAEDMEQAVDMLRKTDERIADIYAKSGNRTAKEYTELMAENSGDGRWLSPDEVVAYGLADEVVEPDAQVTNQYKPSEFGLPDIPQNIIDKMGNINDKKLTAAERFMSWLGIGTDDEVKNFEQKVADKEAEVQALNDKYTEAVATRDAAMAERDTLKADNEAKDARIKALESELAEAKTLAKTKKTEPAQDDPQDPNPTGDEPKKTANQLAYEADVKAFKK